MRWVNRIMVLAALLSISAATAMAQNAECTDEFKTATYTKWYENRKDNQDAAYQAASQFLSTCPNEPADGPWAAQLTALKKFKADYERLKNTNTVAAQFNDAVTKKNNPEIIRLGKQIVATTPDNAVVYIFMASAGLGDA